MKRKTTLRIIGLIMFVIAIIFILVTLSHPEMGNVFYVGIFKIGSTVWRTFYVVYILAIIALFISSFIVKDKKINCSKEKENSNCISFEEYEKYIKNMTTKQKVKYMKNNYILWDFVEDTEEYKKAMEKIQPMLDEEFPLDKWYFGICHEIWERKKELLRDEGIEWKTPTEMNPFEKFK